MEDRIARSHQRIDGDLVLHRIADELKVVGVDDVGEVLDASGGKVVEDGDDVAVPDEPLGQVRPDKPRAAGDEEPLAIPKGYDGRQAICSGEPAW